MQRVSNVCKLALPQVIRKRLGLATGVGGRTRWCLHVLLAHAVAVLRMSVVSVRTPDPTL